VPLGNIYYIRAANPRVDADAQDRPQGDRHERDEGQGDEHLQEREPLFLEPLMYASAIVHRGSRASLSVCWMFTTFNV